MIANVIVDVNSKRVDKVFDYHVPENLQSSIQVGQRVAVPFGPRKIQGFIINLSQETNYDTSKLKDIIAIQDIKPELTEELIALSEWMAHTHISKRISVLDVMLPSAVKGKYKKVLKLVNHDVVDQQLKSYFKNDSITLQKAQDLNILPLMLPYIAEGHIIEDSEVTQQNKIKKVQCVQFNQDYDIDHAIEMCKSDNHKEILAIVNDEPNGYEITTLGDMGYSRAMVNTLVKKGFLIKFEQEQLRDPYRNKVFYEDQKKTLHKEQQNAFDKINHCIQNNQKDTFLIHGVTGSGKTEVYLQLIEQVLNKGKEAILLVPEIALTPQMVERFKSRFGDEVAVLHSGLSQGEKYDEWRRIKNNEARVSVGARSSIFAPFKHLGIIIIDEEHEQTYKQEDYPRYHAREIADKRAEYHQCPVVLGSATPSLESYARAEKGVYQLLKMTTRANLNDMPVTTIINMRDELANGNRSMFSNELAEKIQEKINKGEQIVLFLNRRGHSNFMLCRDCGHVPMCPNCDISLTYHKFNDQLKCHYCGYQEPAINICPSCGSEHIREMGVGTQKVEELLYQKFENAKVIRMDVDTTSRKGAHEKLLNQFKNGEANILLGTQMIAKGLDFPNITLVGVLNADTLLNLPDFRSSEKTYQLITQVSGRAGRSDKKGEVIIQTYNPDHYALQCAKKNDYQTFYETEMTFRKLAKYPPYFYMIHIGFQHESLNFVLKESKHIHKILLQSLTPRSYVLGPSPSPIARINNQYRFQILIKFKSEPALLKALNYLDDYYFELYQKEKFTLNIDINPYMMM